MKLKMKLKPCPFLIGDDIRRCYCQNRQSFGKDKTMSEPLDFKGITLSANNDAAGMIKIADAMKILAACKGFPLEEVLRRLMKKEPKP